jgi:SAM-dependent methyltransferase
MSFSWRGDYASLAREPNRALTCSLMERVVEVAGVRIADQVREYYDANTPAFERFGQSGDMGAIRRAVWGPGVCSELQAFTYVDDLILQRTPGTRAQGAGPVHVLDLGCGTGASIVYLASKSSVSATGVTISPVQAHRAAARIAAAGLERRVRCLQADFLELPVDLEPAALAFSIEAFVHAPVASAYFAAAAARLQPGGLLIVCDDFATARTQGNMAARDAACLADFRDGWIAPSLMTPQAADEFAQRAGLRLLENIDLTPHLQLGRPRDRLLALAVRIGRHLPLRGYRFRSLKGGSALQTAIARGLIEYRFLVWQRS